VIKENFLYFLFLLLITACNPVSQQGNKDETAVSRANSEVPTKHLNYKLIGTEPFWSCDILGDSLHFSNSEGLFVSQKIVSRDTSYTFVSENIKIKLLPENCSDGMSDTKYSYKAKLTLDSLMYEGCAYIIE
jgi:uncharacterized membrane protein